MGGEGDFALFGFNPCFNGFMDKDSMIPIYRSLFFCVSTLVLMDSWIKTIVIWIIFSPYLRFNPCFNGFMDKDCHLIYFGRCPLFCFNPCFNGFMDKDSSGFRSEVIIHFVSTLVLMDSWIKTFLNSFTKENSGGFNPCFNGFMDKDCQSN